LYDRIGFLIIGILGLDREDKTAIAKVQESTRGGARGDRGDGGPINY
jgi:hypothetical protein